MAATGGNAGISPGGSVETPTPTQAPLGSWGTTNPGTVGKIGARWLIAFAGTWFVLAAMSDSQKFNELADAIAVTIAFSATVLFYQPFLKGVGF